ncbi:taste receptor type 2 member 40-like [Hyperolius riggenbachi]|uniref:taste receptor type 2 member 40-like n=1 Tax=Hyperolius riggenbachi TaxID=752182 RepID=UPI0035A3CE44
MQVSNNVVTFIVSVIITVVGTLLNATILTVHFRDWRNIRNCGPCDQLLFSMILTSLFFQCSMFFHGALIDLQLLRQMNITFLLLSLYIMLSLTSIRFWNKALLSIWYCMKLLTVTHPILFTLKSKFCSFVVHLLVATALMPFLTNLPIFWMWQMPFSNTTSYPYESFECKPNTVYLLFITGFQFILPSCLTFICIVLSVRSLLSHMWRVHQNMSMSSPPPQLQALTRATLTMTLHLMLDLSFTAVIVYSFSQPFSYEPGLGSPIFVILFPSAQSIILIFGNTKLKNSLLGKIHTLLFERLYLGNCY